MKNQRQASRPNQKGESRQGGISLLLKLNLDCQVLCCSRVSRITSLKVDERISTVYYLDIVGKKTLLIIKN